MGFLDWMKKGGEEEPDRFERVERPERERRAVNNFDREMLKREEPRGGGVGATEIFNAQPEEKVFFSKTSKPDPRSYLQNNMNVVVYNPKTYQDVQRLIDHLKRREPVIIDLAGISQDSVQRIMDFLSGAIYGVSGSIHRISGSIFLLTPEGVSIQVPINFKNVKD